MSVTLATLQGTIARALALRPVDRSRIEKAASLIAFGHVEQIAPDAYTVRSQTNAGVTYRVNPYGCSCVDAARRTTSWCKHAYAVRLLLAAEIDQRDQAGQEARQRVAADNLALAVAGAVGRAA